MPVLDHASYKDSMRKIWSTGDYQQLAERVYPLAQKLCEQAEVVSNKRVIDIGTGTGNVAIAAARKRAEVVALDLTPKMITLTQARVAGEKLAVSTVIGDAEDIPFRESYFDIALSACGLWWAPDPARAVKEMRRVLKKGGTVGLAGFTPDSYFGRIAALLKPRSPREWGSLEPNDWARADIVAERLSPTFSSIKASNYQVPWKFPSVEQAVSFLFSNSSPHIVALQSAAAEVRREIIESAENLTREFANDGGSVDIDLDCMIVTATAE